MLFYSLSCNKVISIPPLKKLVTTKIIENLWNTTFIPKDIDTFITLSEPGELAFEKWLTEQQEQTIIISKAFIKENNLPSMFKKDFKESVYLFCRANIQVFHWQMNYDSICKIDNIGAILFNAQSYFTVDGEFDDLAWTKHVVLNPVYPIIPRFYLACHYCLEYETSLLWSDLKSNDSLPNYGELNEIWDQMDPFVTFRIFQLKNQIEAFPSKVYEDGFQAAIVRDYEYGSRYFWEKIVEPKKIIEKEFFFHLLIYSGEKTMFFLYSQLSKKQKKKILEFSFGICSFWITLLLSPYTEAERSDTVELVCKLPFGEISCLFADIARGSGKHSFPFHREEVMVALWTHLSQETRGKVLMENPIIIKYLIHANQLNFADYMMCSLSLKQKENYFSANPLMVKILELSDEIRALKAVLETALQLQSSLKPFLTLDAE